jgi:antitoxin component HigA of HigAB toxin-antitoxin module
MPSTTRKTAGRDAYFQFVRAFPLRRIRSKAEHETAKSIFLRHSSARDRETREYLDVLADLIADYEQRARQAIDTSKVSPAELVRHRMLERQLTLSALAKQIGVPQPNLSEMLNGRRDWSKTAIRELSRIFNIRAERFLT